MTAFDVCEVMLPILSNIYVVHDAIIEYLTKRGYYPGPPRLEHLNISAERVLLKDRDIASVVGVSPRNGYLRCEHDHSDDCIHVKFAYELEEVIEVC